jgi:hypothetical protein
MTQNLVLGWSPSQPRRAPRVRHGREVGAAGSQRQAAGSGVGGVPSRGSWPSMGQYWARPDCEGKKRKGEPDGPFLR